MGTKEERSLAASLLARGNKGGGRPATPKRCELCGEVLVSATEYRKHFAGVQA